MKRQVVERLFAVAGLSVLLAIGVMVSLGITAAPSIWAQEETQELEMSFELRPPRVPAGEYFTLTVEIRGAGLVSVTEMNLQIVPPPILTDQPEGLLSPVISAAELADLEPGKPFRYPVMLQCREDVVPDTYPFTAKLEYTHVISGIDSPMTITETGWIEVAPPLSSLPSSTPSPSPEVPPSPIDTPTPTAPTPMPTVTSEPASPTPTLTVVTPTPTPTLTPTPSSPFESIITWGKELFSRSPELVLLSCLVPLGILLLVFVVIILARRKRRAAPPTPGPARAPSPPPPTGSYLEGADVAGKVHRFPLTDELSIGRAEENDLVITEGFPGWETVSRYHARVFQQGAFWIVADLQSSNGVYVNGQRTGLNRLSDNSRLGIGGVEFVFRTGKEANDELS